MKNIIAMVFALASVLFGTTALCAKETIPFVPVTVVETTPVVETIKYFGKPTKVDAVKILLTLSKPSISYDEHGGFTEVRESLKKWLLDDKTPKVVLGVDPVVLKDKPVSTGISITYFLNADADTREHRLVDLPLSRPANFRESDLNDLKRSMGQQCLEKYPGSEIQWMYLYQWKSSFGAVKVWGACFCIVTKK